MRHQHLLFTLLCAACDAPEVLYPCGFGPCPDTDGEPATAGEDGADEESGSPALDDEACGAIAALHGLPPATTSSEWPQGSWSQLYPATGKMTPSVVSDETWSWDWDPLPALGDGATLEGESLALLVPNLPVFSGSAFVWLAAPSTGDWVPSFRAFTEYYIETSVFAGDVMLADGSYAWFAQVPGPEYVMGRWEGLEEIPGWRSADHAMATISDDLGDGYRATEAEGAGWVPAGGRCRFE